MRTIIKKVEDHISFVDASGIATRAMSGEDEARCLVIADSGRDLFIKESNKIRRATNDEWEEYTKEKSEFS